LAKLWENRVAEIVEQPAAPKRNTMLALTQGITDAQLTEIYQDRYIQRVGYDDRPASPVVHPLASYVSAFADNVFSGAFLLIEYSEREIEIHGLLLKKAIKHSRELLSMMIDIIFANRNVLRITANVIQGIETARNFCLKMGFKLEGIKRSVCLVKGKPTDLYVLGLLRQDWRAS
jgi:hypothetical protein